MNLLRQIILEEIEKQSEFKQTALGEIKKVQIADDLTSFVKQAIGKYIRGQMEHGGNIEDRNLNHEIDQELIDLFFYHSANKRKELK